MGLHVFFLSNFIFKTNLVFRKSSFCYNVDIIGGDLSHKLKVMFISFGYFFNVLDFEQEFISSIGINLVTLIWQCLCEFDTVYSCSLCSSSYA